MTSKLDPQELERLAQVARRRHSIEQANTSYGVMPSGEFGQIARALTAIADKLRTGQLVPAMPSGDVVEAVSGVAKMREALTWYAEKVHLCRKITSEGQDARRLLDTDGGAFARAALGEKP